MRGLEGLDVLRHIRAGEAGEAGAGADHVPVIVVTAHSEREHRLRGLEAGADDFLEKPADGRSLRVRVATLLQLKESRDALRRLNEELESRNAELGHLQRQQRELTAFVVHDLKNPLTVIWSGLSFVHTQVHPDDRRVEEALKSATLSCQRLRSMIDDLLVISRLEDYKFPIHNELIILSDFLRDIFSEYVRQAADKHVRFVVPPRTNFCVNADRGLLQRIIENILDNSLRYTPEHGRMGIATRANGEIEIVVS